MSLQEDNTPTVYKNLINLCILNTRYGPVEHHGHLQSLEQAKDAIKNIITVRAMKDPGSNEDIESRLKAFSPTAPIRMLGGYPPGVDQTGQHAGHTVVYSIVCDAHGSVCLIVDNTGDSCYGDFSRMTFTVPWEKYHVVPADSVISKARALYDHLKAIRLGTHPFPLDGRQLFYSLLRDTLTPYYKPEREKNSVSHRWVYLSAFFSGAVCKERGLV